MPDDRRWRVSDSRKFSAAAFGALGVFTMCLGTGLGNWPVVGLGIAVAVGSVSLVVVSAVRGGTRSFVRGTAHVLDATEPPANTPIGRCELQIVIEAQGLAPAKVKIRDTKVPVAKWPDIGDTLPIRVAVEDPRHVRILWDEVRTHGEEAAEEERFQEYVQRLVDAELAGELDPEDIPDGQIADLRPARSEAAPAVPAQRPRPSPHPRRLAGGATAAAVLARPNPSGIPKAAFPEGQAAPGLSRSRTGPADTVDSAAAAVRGAPAATPAREPLADAASDPVDEAAASAVAAIADRPPSTVDRRAASARQASTVELLITAGPSQRTKVPVPDDETPVHDVVPIEGASAVLGVPPTTPESASRAEADADAVRDLLAALPSARPGPSGSIHSIGMTLIVADLSRTVDFYRDKLGFYVVDAGTSSAILASGDTRLMVRSVPDMPRVGHRLVHINLEVGDVEATYAELVAKGVRFIHRPRPVARGEHIELWAAAFRDPDGHGIALIKWVQLPSPPI